MQFFIGRGESGLDTNFTATQVSFVAPIMAMITALVMFAQLRSFRALPLSKAQITSLLVLCPMVFALIFGLIVTGLHLVLFGGPVIWSHFFVSQISAGGMILVVPALLWFGLSIKTFAVVVLIFPGMQVLQEFRGAGRPSRSDRVLGAGSLRRHFVFRDDANSRLQPALAGERAAISQLQADLSSCWLQSAWRCSRIASSC